MGLIYFVCKNVLHWSYTLQKLLRDYFLKYNLSYFVDRTSLSAQTVVRLVVVAPLINQLILGQRTLQSHSTTGAPLHTTVCPHDQLRSQACQSPRYVDILSNSVSLSSMWQHTYSTVSKLRILFINSVICFDRFSRQVGTIIRDVIDSRSINACLLGLNYEEKCI